MLANMKPIDKRNKEVKPVVRFIWFTERRFVHYQSVRYGKSETDSALFFNCMYEDADPSEKRKTEKGEKLVLLKV